MRKSFKILLIFFGTVVLLILGVSATALISSTYKKPIFINKDLVFQNPLSIPPLLESKVQNEKKKFELTLQEGTKEFFENKQTKTWGINGDYLGPTLRMKTGDNVAIDVTNTLPETTTIHWHGMELPGEMDGGPHQPIEPGAEWRPNWTVKNEASTLWYHPHTMEKTGRHVYNGLAGMIIVEDENSTSLSIPKTYGIDDIPLIIQDKKFDTNGQFVYDHDHMNHRMTEITAGMLGNTILVNGTYAPYLEIPNKIIRLRLLNASNARRYNFGFSDNRMFYQIATDGGFLQTPVEKNRVELAPGERAEILVDLTSIEKPVTLISYPVTEDENKVRGFVLNAIVGGNDENQKFNILELRPQKVSQKKVFPSESIPQELNTIKRYEIPKEVKTRIIKLDTAAINGKKMDMERIDETVKKDDVEIWEVRNESPTYHPFHIHGVQFQILDRDGLKPLPEESGWKDTVMIMPAKSVRLIMQFRETASEYTPYMYHCHILEHEDMGMMGQLTVTE